MDISISKNKELNLTIKPYQVESIALPYICGPTDDDYSIATKELNGKKLSANLGKINTFGDKILRTCNTGVYIKKEKCESIVFVAQSMQNSTGKHFQVIHLDDSDKY